MSKIEIISCDFKNALQSVAPKKTSKTKKPFPLIIYKEGRGQLVIADAKYEAKGAVIKCRGTLNDGFEIDGYKLRLLSQKYPENATIVLDISETQVVIRCQDSVITIPRLDAGGKKTVKQALRNTGKPEHLPEPIEKRAEFNDTWGFSARVPMPACTIKKTD